IFSTWRLALFDGLRASADPVLSAIAGKGVKELTYLRDYAAQWVVRLGDGTPLSHERMQNALAAIWPLLGELFQPDDFVAVPPAVVDAVIDPVLAAGRLDRPDAAALAGGSVGGVRGRAGRGGVHTEAMGYILAELQSLARAHPDATW